MDATFIHAFDDPAVMAGNGTIGLEILEDLPDVDAIVIPWGGGGLACGIAAAVRALKPDTRIYAAEVATAAPLAAALAAGAPVEVDYTPSFVDGIGSKTVFPQMLERARGLIDGALVAPSWMQVAAALRLLAERNRVIAEGAGACPVAVRSPARRAAARSSAWSRAATSISASSPKSSAAPRDTIGQVGMKIREFDQTHRSRRLASRPMAWRQPPPIQASDEAECRDGERQRICGCQTRYAERHSPHGRIEEMNEATVQYVVIFETDGDGYSAYVPDLPGCIAAGDTRAEVEDLIREGIIFHIEGLKLAGLPVPPPMSIAESVAIPASIAAD